MNAFPLPDADTSTLPCRAKARAQTSWIAADIPEVLDRIHDDAVHLALWQRDRPSTLDWLDALDFDEIDDVQETFGVADLASSIPAALKDAGYPDDRRGEALGSEVTALARMFARVMQGDAVRMRLEIVETDACRKFHMDNVKARMLVPLTEPGTQWITAAVEQDASINQLAAGNVGLFKGRIWAEEPAILHRSPPIAGTDISRLLLVLDLPRPDPETF